MSEVKKFRPVHDTARQNALQAVKASPDGWVCRLSPETRSEAQNRLLHPLLTDIAQQCEWMGKKRPMLQWKTILVSAHAIATKAPNSNCSGRRLSAFTEQSNDQRQIPNTRRVEKGDLAAPAFGGEDAAADR